MFDVSTNIKHNPKTKVTDMEQIFEIIDDKPYYSLKYKKVVVGRKCQACIDRNMFEKIGGIKND